MDTFMSTYVDDHADPSTGEPYRLISWMKQGSIERGDIAYGFWARCGTDGTIVDILGTGPVGTFTIKLESGGYYCASNQPL